MNRWLPFEWIAAVRFLREGRMQTLFIIGGIAIVSDHFNWPRSAHAALFLII